jgi:hypothetical protein
MTKDPQQDKMSIADPSLRPWEEPVGSILDVQEALQEFFVNLASMSIDFERMARTGVLPMYELAHEVARLNLTYLVKIGELSPAVLRYYENNQPIALQEKTNKTILNAKKDTHYQRSDTEMKNTTISQSSIDYI